MTKTILLAAGLALGAIGAGGALAHDEKGEHKTVKKIVITHADGSERTVDVDKMRAHAMVHCDGAAHRFEHSDQSADGDKKKINKVVICGKGDGDRLAALEKARERLSGEQALGVDPRAKALAALDAEIARLKAEKK